MNKEEIIKNLTIEDIDKWHEENNDQTYTEFCKEYVEAVDLLDNYSKRVVKYRQENTNLKQALNEIREYVYQHEYCRFGHIDGGEADEIYKIIDKVLGGNND